MMIDDFQLPAEDIHCISQDIGLYKNLAYDETNQMIDESMILSPPRIKRGYSGDGGDSTAHTMSHNISSKRAPRCKMDEDEEEKVPSSQMLMSTPILTSKRIR
jgi:hypothetical protein